MKYKLTIKGSEESIKILECEDQEDAIRKFVRIKKLSRSQFLSIYEVKLA